MALLTTASTVLAIADATGLTSWLGNKIGGKAGSEVTSKVSAIAQKVTGKEDLQQALKVVEEDPKLAQELKKTLLEHEHEIDKAILDDIANAREMYKETDHEVADGIAWMIMRYNPLFVILLVVVQVLIFLAPHMVDIDVDTSVYSTISLIIGSSITYLWNERATVTTFYYGSSKKFKDPS